MPCSRRGVSIPSRGHRAPRVCCGQKNRLWDKSWIVLDWSLIIALTKVFGIVERIDSRSELNWGLDLPNARIIVLVDANCSFGVSNALLPCTNCPDDCNAAV